MECLQRVDLHQRRIDFCQELLLPREGAVQAVPPDPSLAWLITKSDDAVKAYRDNLVSYRDDTAERRGLLAGRLRSQDREGRRRIVHVGGMLILPAGR